MLTVAQDNPIAIAIAVLIGIVVGWWIFRAVRGDRRVSDGEADAQAVDQPKQRLIRDGVDTIEGRGLADEMGAAARDVAGEILGVDAHTNLPSASGPPDNLQTLKGVGPKLAAQLNANGITRFDQLAALSSNEVEILDSRLGAFRGRVARDRLVEQAAYLARGDTDGFEAVFGKLGNA
jgi:predicted flap endonuclease-1-like 5' DNA nuclease